MEPLNEKIIEQMLAILEAMPPPPLMWLGVAQQSNEHEWRTEVGPVTMINNSGGCAIGNHHYYERGVAIRHVSDTVIAVRPPYKPNSRKDDPLLVVVSLFDGQTLYYRFAWSHRTDEWTWYRGVPRAGSNG